MAAKKICSDCGNIGFPKKITPGSFFIELILWLMMILPGLIYSIWRLTNRKEGCPKCSGTIMIPLNSPRGKKLAKEFAEDSE